MECLDKSRSTVDRAVTELCDVDCLEPVEVAGSEFRITTTGELALQSYREYCAESAALAENAKLLNTLPDGEELSKTFFFEADVYSSSRTPDVAIQPGADLLEDATKMVGTAPVAKREYFDSIIHWLESGDSRLELVLEAELVTSIDQTYQAKFEELKDFDRVTVYEIDEQLPYALWVMDRDEGDYAGITIYEDGGVKGALVTDSKPAVEWARDQYDRYRRRSIRLG